MRVTLMTLGTRGDVQPFVTLAAGLRAAGHQATVCSSASFAPLAEQQGVPFEPLALDFTELQDGASSAAAMKGDVRAIRAAIKAVRPAFARSLLDQQRAVEATEPDILLTHPKTLGGPHLAEWRGIPHVGSLVVPGFTTTTAFPPIPLTWTGTPGWLNRAAYRMIPAGMSSFKGVVASFRTQKLGLPGKTELWDGGRTMLYGYSPAVVPNPADWPATARAVGYWLPEVDAADEPPTDLLEFLSAGQRPIFVGFGSMMDTDPTSLGRLVTEAVARAGVRAVVQASPGLLDAHASDQVHVIDGAPHGWLFPRMAAIVHHGGSGTTGEALRARVPQVVVPFSVDQPFWAKRMQGLGVAPTPLRRKDLTADRLATAISLALGSQSMADRAEEIGDRVLAEDGVGEGVRFLERAAQGWRE